MQAPPERVDTYTCILSLCLQSRRLAAAAPTAAQDGLGPLADIALTHAHTRRPLSPLLAFRHCSR